ncbi:DUF7402 domain-containing protein [Martelella endophytica]|uniref:Carbohydrate-binding protein n=1 Tax=Martelella endophytica TaxID=1486262 RepID=A0A0D5LQ79_MAREN|nr:carbohydrate-binding protein [Martelella endophytica]AJY45488.1 carbohydrate-binding protein [Martelella endophytica]
MEIALSVLDKTGAVRARKQGRDALSLVFDAAYEAGDSIVVETDMPGAFLTLSLDNALPPATLYMKEGRFCLPVPQGDARTVYAPTAFAGERHRLAACAALPDSIGATRNLALNPFDHNENQALFPHASASVETRGEAAFAARNAIDGESANDNHGFWPYTSWGINSDPEATFTLTFGRPVTVGAVALVTRADFPHDAWWTAADIAFSDGTRETLPLTKTGAAQRFAFAPRTIEWLRLERLIKADDPSPFPALTQIEVWGQEA